MTNPSWSACEDEPIHAPGTIQPHGVLLALDPVGLTVVHASDNSGMAFGDRQAPVVGAEASELLGPAAVPALREIAASRDPGAPSLVPVKSGGGEGWNALAHRAGELLFVELERTEGSAPDPQSLLSATRASVTGLTGATVADLCAGTAREVRRLTGYDRVMIYRFDPDWNGRVVAEERRSDLEPYLGLHYPASDIPAQARALYLANRLRVIPDATARPVLVQPGSDRMGRPLDLGRCLLRAVSPVHLEYLANMGVRATLTASLVVGDRLWGLIACHHLAPRRPSLAEREACDLLARFASAALAAADEADDREYRAHLWDVVNRLETTIAAATPPASALTREGTDLLAVTGAAGAVVWRAGRAVLVGRTPPAIEVQPLVAWLKEQGTSLFVTDRLPLSYPPASGFAADAAGLVSAAVSADAEEYVLWFRPEVAQTVTWGGDPGDRPDTVGRLSPRRSFAAWREVVRGRSLSWRPAEVEAAGRLRSLLASAASRSAARLERMLPICAWCKRVRDEPGYWRQVEAFIQELADVRLTHGICPTCLASQQAEFDGKAL